jgi:hypothetical protein
MMGTRIRLEWIVLITDKKDVSHSHNGKDDNRPAIAFERLREDVVQHLCQPVLVQLEANGELKIQKCFHP